MKFLKITAVAALAISLVGCGNDNDSKANTVAAANKYQPKIIKGTALAFQFHESSSPVFEPITELVTECKSMVMSQFAMDDADGLAKFNQFWTESGLAGNTPQWIVLSVGGLTREVIEGQKDAIPEVAVALSLNHDLERVISALRACISEKDSKELVETTVADLKSWKIVSDDLSCEPCVTSLDGSLMLFAATPEQLERQVKLYRDGVDASETIVPDTTAVIRVAISNVGELTKLAMADDSPDRAYIDNALPVKGFAKMLDNLGKVDAVLTATDEEATCKSTLEFKTEEDAKAMLTISEFLQLAVKSQLVANDPNDLVTKLMSEALASTKTTVNGKDVVSTITFKRDFVAGIATLLREGICQTAGIGCSDDEEEDDE